MKKFTFPIIFALFGITVIAFMYANLKQRGMTVCEGSYALCTSARCIPNPSNPLESLCFCEVHQGKSLGETRCSKRKSYTDSNGIEHIISTFSFKDFPSKKVMTCPSGNPWSNCLDQKCIVDPQDPSKSICSCQIIRTGAYQTLGGNCDSSTCATGYWSGATDESNKQIIDFFTKALGLKKSPERLCSE